ncbi:MAG: flagellar hook-associated protein FlgK [Thermodesulfobacteriota bacterium]
MAGVSHVLSIAKEALLTHQMSIQVASNNIANVDTPGYTRQMLELGSNPSTPVSAGNLGGGVRSSEIMRVYDQFMVQRLIEQQSTMGELEAQQNSMRLIEAVFNEAPGLAINDLMNQFWTSWQTLSNNPELPASRQAVVQSGQLLVDQLHAMSAEMAQAKYDIGVSLNTGIADVNSIVSQIATLNGQISGAEAAGHTANDLRDNRDQLLSDLSELLNISSFENSAGSTTVLLADGHTLVADIEYWQVDWENNELIWVNRDSNGEEARKSLGNNELGGKIGGWLQMRANIEEGDPNNFLGRLNDFAKSLIREINQQHSQGVGMVLFGDTTTGTEQASNVARLTTPVDSASAINTIPAGTITINNRKVGEILGGGAVNGLAMAKTANAVEAINKAEAGVEARLTTLTAGNAVDATDILANDTISFTVNDVSVNYTVVAGDVGDEAAFSAHLVAAINAALTAHNTATSTTNPVTIEAVVGDGTNGGASNAIVLRNINAGDEAAITVDNLSGTFAGAATTSDLGLDALEGVAQKADTSHNTGEITLFSQSSFTVEGGTNDYYLAQLGMGGGNLTTTYYDGGAVTDPAGIATTITFNLNGTAVTASVLAADDAATMISKLQTGIDTAFAPASSPVTVSLVNGSIRFTNSASGDNTDIVVDSFTTTAGNGAIFGFGNFTAQVGGVAGDSVANDGTFTFDYEDGPAGPLLAGFDYFDELNLDSGTFDIWIYNNDGSLAMPDPVTISLDRAYTLDDAVSIINKTVAVATNGSGWVTASNSLNSLRLTPDAAHQIAFANDTTNILQVTGLNTFFSGSDAASINVNSLVANDLNLLAAATVTQTGEVYRGDNTNALAIAGIQHDEYVTYTGGRQNTLDGFYNALVGDVANNTRTVERAYEFNTLVRNQMNEMRDSVSGVSLDEEMASLVKYQQAYTAAARLITMSDEMLTTLLDAVR